ncbi:hypothetical protein ATE80_16605 [Streptomyces kanasensis]|uniref:Uncharacterized protein n=1 Tax=Streptomyces kanasensis TaxID=936756 RepID=A0A117IVL6_9ACTN|nr:hypothetical protein ATE80_16605 [Streptomyces kanasensis]
MDFDGARVRTAGDRGVAGGASGTEGAGAVLTARRAPAPGPVRITSAARITRVARTICTAGASRAGAGRWRAGRPRAPRRTAAALAGRRAR